MTAGGCYCQACRSWVRTPETGIVAVESRGATFCDRCVTRITETSPDACAAIDRLEGMAAADRLLRARPAAEVRADGRLVPYPWGDDYVRSLRQRVRCGGVHVPHHVALEAAAELVALDRDQLDGRST